MIASSWLVADRAPDEFLRAFPLHQRLLAQVLHARGCRTPDDARTFLAADPDDGDAAQMKGMPEAVDRILRAVAAREQVVIYADYDCDGVCSAAILFHTLALLDATPEVYIPDRFDEGYGLHAAALTRLQAQGAALVVTVDCGARAMREASHARQLGLDLIITDHHELEDDQVPDALAVINPRQPGCNYPYKRLAGAGVAYRLAQALLRAAGREPRDAHALLDLVAVGTVADVMPLTGQNRALVRDGLARLNTAPRLGLAELARAARVAPGRVTARDLGFALGPRLNAAGRIDHARSALDLLLTDRTEWARELADHLNDRNNQRQKLTQDTLRAAEALITPAGADAPPALLFAASPDFSTGVIGLVAARLADKHIRPAIAVAIDGPEARGSCRSVGGFHITQALDACAPLMLRHGGHAAAAGFTARTDQLAALQAQLTGIVTRQQPAAGWTRAVRADGVLSLDLFGATTARAMRMHDALRALEPHGQENPAPAFVAHGLIATAASRFGRAEPGHEPAHLRASLRDASGRSWDAIGWQMGGRVPELPPGARIDAAFQLDLHEWNDTRRLRLQLMDFANTAILDGPA